MGAISGTVGGVLAPVGGVLSSSVNSLVRDIIIGASLGAGGGGIDYVIKAQLGMVEWNDGDFLSSIGTGAVIGGALGALSHLNTDVRNSLNHETSVG